MPSKSNNIFTRIKENVMGTKEENAQAEKDMARYKASKEKEKMDAEAKKTKMAKGGMPAKKKTAAKKKPSVAIMIAVGKPKMKNGGMPVKKK